MTTAVTSWLGLLCLCASALAPRFALAQASDVPYVATPQNVVDAMLELARVGPNDFVIDLGSGDGRIVITAAKKYGARGFGVDLDGALVSQARREAQKQGVADRVEFHARNLFITDIDQATVLTSYLFTNVNMQLRPRLFSELKPGTRVVSHEFDFGNWKPDAQVRVAVPGKSYGPPSSDVFLWIVPANAAGRWQWRLTVDGRPVECELALQQTFQVLEGAARCGSVVARVTSAKLRGAEIELVVSAFMSGREVTQELAGRVYSDSMQGKARVAGAAHDTPWSATRLVRGGINIDAAADAPTAIAAF